MDKYGGVLNFFLDKHLHPGSFSESTYTLDAMKREQTANKML